MNFYLSYDISLWEFKSPCFGARCSVLIRLLLATVQLRKRENDKTMVLHGSLPKLIPALVIIDRFQKDNDGNICL